MLQQQQEVVDHPLEHLHLLQQQHPAAVEIDLHRKAQLPDVDPDGLLEFSVVFTDRSLNHMSQSFQQVMRDISDMLKNVYKADGVAIIPECGTRTERGADIMFVCAGGNPAIFDDKSSFAWLRRLARRGTTLGGISGGPYILARAGLLDEALGMLAEDVAPNRLERAKAELTSFLRRQEDSRIGLVLFAGAAFVQCSCAGLIPVCRLIRVGEQTAHAAYALVKRTP